MPAAAIPPPASPAAVAAPATPPSAPPTITTPQPAFAMLRPPAIPSPPGRWPQVFPPMACAICPTSPSLPPMDTTEATMPSAPPTAIASRFPAAAPSRSSALAVLLPPRLHLPASWRWSTRDTVPRDRRTPSSIRCMRSSLPPSATSPSATTPSPARSCPR